MHKVNIQQYHFTPANRLINSAIGLDTTTRARTVQQALFSTSIQHGAGGARRVFRGALEGLGYPPNEITTTNPTDAALIRAVYAERRAGNGSKYFPSSTQAIRNSVVNRFHNEEADALVSLNKKLTRQMLIRKQWNQRTMHRLHRQYHPMLIRNN